LESIPDFLFGVMFVCVRNEKRKLKNNKTVAEEIKKHTKN